MIIETNESKRAKLKPLTLREIHEKLSEIIKTNPQLKDELLYVQLEQHPSQRGLNLIRPNYGPAKEIVRGYKDYVICGMTWPRIKE